MSESMLFGLCCAFHIIDASMCMCTSDAFARIKGFNFTQIETGINKPLTNPSLRYSVHLIKLQGFTQTCFNILQTLSNPKKKNSSINKINREINNNF